MSSSTKLKENLEARLTRVAEMTRSAVEARICVLSLMSNGRRIGLARSGCSTPEFGAAADAMLEVLSLRRGLEDHAEGGTPLLKFAGTELATLRGNSFRFGEEVHAVARAQAEGSCEADAAIIAPAERPDRDLDAVAALGCEAALAILTTSEGDSSREFWRNRATAALDAAARIRSECEELKRSLEGVDQLPSLAAGLGPRDRYAALGAMVAGDGPFDGWILAIDVGGGLEPVASSRPDRVSGLDEPSALRKSYVEQSVLSGRGFTPSAGACSEDRVFARPYVCVPLETGAIALASRTPISETVRARIHAKVRRLAPIVKSWCLEEELGRERELVRKLGLRMFAAIDEERSRIARDLHDDQAQLLAAAQIALEGGRDQARGIFKSLETELRRRVRELRPAKLGEASLDEALRLEAGRLTEAGIKVHLKRLRRANREPLSRPVEELCYQVAREAFSNVLRHSSATRVEVIVERLKGAARISVADDGRGIEPDAARNGMGLRGLRERLELMGGILTIESKPGATRLVAEIPEPS